MYAGVRNDKEYEMTRLKPQDNETLFRLDRYTDAE